MDRYAGIGNPQRRVGSASDDGVRHRAGVPGEAVADALPDHSGYRRAGAQLRGDLILETDPSLAYEDLDMEKIWAGKLTFPVEFEVISVSTNSPGSRLTLM